MLFTIIRLGFWGAAFIISFVLIKKSRVIHKRRWSIVALVAAIILTTISALLPIENAFITFSSPESAYRYNNFGDVKLIVNGGKTDFIVGANGDEDVYAIVPKSNNGWKLGTGVETKRILQTVSDGVVIYVYQYKNTDDYYITVFDTNGGSSDIMDNHDSEFKYLETYNNALNETFYTYYAYIGGFDDQYALTVNGKSIKVQI